MDIDLMLRSILSYHSALLTKELKRLRQTSMSMKNFPVVYHDSVNTIIVFGGPQFKAFVPKKFNGWSVEYREWSGEEEALVKAKNRLIEDEFAYYFSNRNSP